MIPFILGALAAVGLSELSKSSKVLKMANGGGVSDIKREIDDLYSKSNFINTDFNWRLKLLEMLQDQSVEAYNIYQKLTKKQKDDVLQEQFEVDNDMGSDGDGDIETTKENLAILLKDAKNGKQYANGGGVTDSFLHLYKLTYPDGFYIVESYDGEYMSPKEAMEKMRINVKNFKSYKYKGVSSQNPKYKDWNYRKDIGYSNTEAWDEVFENETYANGGGVGDLYSKFDLNEKGNFSAVIDNKNYEIIYRDDTSQLYDLFENNKKIKSSKVLRDLMQFPKYANGGGVLSNKEKIINLEFEDNSDRKLGRYDFSFETIDSQGAFVLDYDGYLIESASESRMPDEIEWGQNMPEDWENAEKYILDSFYSWKHSKKKYANGGGVGEEIVDFVRGFKYIKPSGKRGHYSYTEFMPYGRSMSMFKKEFNYPNKNSDGFLYEPYKEINLGQGVVQKIRIENKYAKGGGVADLEAAKFFSKMFQSRDIAHKAHLQTESFAAHEALNKYYDGILPLVDGLVESYQGMYGKIDIPEWKTDTKEIVPYLESVLKYIQEHKDKVFTDSSLLNQVDEIKEMVQSTLYKLKELS